MVILLKRLVLLLSISLYIFTLVLSININIIKYRWWTAILVTWLERKKVMSYYTFLITIFDTCQSTFYYFKMSNFLFTSIQGFPMRYYAVTLSFFYTKKHVASFHTNKSYLCINYCFVQTLKIYSHSDAQFSLFEIIFQCSIKVYSTINKIYRHI